MNLPATYTTMATLQTLMAQPGRIDVHVHQLRGLHVPFIFHTGPDGEQVPHGPIVRNDQVIAHADLEALKAALRESLGGEIRTRRT